MDTNTDVYSTRNVSVEPDSVKFLTVDQFAKRIGVHPQTVRKWDNDGVLRAHHKTPSGRRLYTEEQITEYFNR